MSSRRDRISIEIPVRTLHRVILASLCFLGVAGCKSPRHSEQTAADAVAAMPAEQFELQLQESASTPRFTVQVESKPTGFAKDIAQPLSQSVWRAIQSCPAVQAQLRTAAANGVLVSFSLQKGEVLISSADATAAARDATMSCLVRNLRQGEFPTLAQPVVTTFRVRLDSAQEST